MAYALRNYRELIDPESTLPYVTMRTREDIEVTGTNILSHIGVELIIAANDEEIGTCQLAQQFWYTEDSSERQLHFGGRGIEILKQFRGQSYGAAAYITAIEYAARQDFGFESDYVLSQHAVRMWKVFVKAGLAVVDREPSFTYSHIQGDEQLHFYSGHFHLQ